MRTTLLLSALLAFTMSSQAASITINNAGFEDPDVGSGSIVNGSTANWTVSSYWAGTWNINSFIYFNAGAPEGSQILFVGYNGVSADVSQTLSATVLPNTTYTLTFSLGHRNDLDLSVYSVALEGNGSTILATDTAGAPTAGNWVPRTLTFDSASAPGTVGQTLGIYIHATGLSAAGTYAQADFDNFALNTVTDSSTGSGTPEPATFGVIGAGLCAIVFARRRMK